MNKNIIVKTDRLKVREFSLEDSKKVFSMSNEKGIKKWMPDQVYSDLDETKKVLNFLIAQYKNKPNPSNKPYVLGIALKSNEKLIGHIGLSAIEEGIEIGYAITDKYQARGFATEAVSEFSSWALNNLALESIWGVVNKNNKGSIKVLEKSNYKYIDKRNNKLIYIYKN